MKLATRYMHSYQMHGVMCDYIFDTAEEAVEAAKKIQDEHFQPAGAWLARDYYRDVEVVYIVASGASYWNASKYLGQDLAEEEERVTVNLDVLEKGLYSAPFQKAEDGGLGRSGMVVRFYREGYTSPKFYFEGWGAGIESEENFVGARERIDLALHMLDAYLEVGHDGNEMNAIARIFAKA